VVAASVPLLLHKPVSSAPRRCFHGENPSSSSNAAAVAAAARRFSRLNLLPPFFYITARTQPVGARQPFVREQPRTSALEPDQLVQ
jgi:hypothetical protein